MKAIEFELQLLDKAGEFKTELRIIGTPVKIDPQKELIIFRIVQEALNNIIKHSQADTVTVEINFKEKLLILSIWDNGKGFQLVQEKDEMETGSGLRNMRNRAGLIGGSFDIESSTAFGTKIQITVPITET